ncbi:hypothetical protein BDR26DRAFT_329956 [Obelidium mucronatum]|nr:hypothetical protein BDR26DRAFT_329956 [Obelidium mucronatum]
MGLTASPRKIPSTPMDTPTLKQRFINRPDTSLTGLFLRKRIPPLSIESSENDSSHYALSPEKGDELELDGLEFAFANSLTPSKTAGPPIRRRASGMASSRRQTQTHQQVSPIKGGGGDGSVLPNMELVEAEYTAWFKRIQRFQYTSLFFSAVSVVSLGFIYFSDDVVVSFSPII